MPGVRVYVDYDLVLEDTNDPPSMTYTVTPVSVTMQVRIYTFSGTLYKVFSPVVALPGDFTFVWNQLSPAGTPVPSGVYYVSYMKDGQEVLRYPLLVRDHVVATTDTLGRYTITNEALPVDFYPVPQYSGDRTRFFGNYRVSDLVYLTFVPAGSLNSILRPVRVVKDRAVEMDVRFN